VALDDFMVEAENLTLLFAALNEDTFDVRTIAISVLGRLMPHKPADVMPHLRTLLTELLTGAAPLAAPYRIGVTPHTTTPLLHALPTRFIHGHHSTCLTDIWAPQTLPP